MPRAAVQRRAVAATRVSGGAEVLWLGEDRLRLGHLLGRPLASFYEWQGPLGRLKTWPQIWTSFDWFRSPETYPKTVSFFESELNSQNLPCLLRKLALPFKATWPHQL